jgi:hypothetical protein
MRHFKSEKIVSLDYFFMGNGGLYYKAACVNTFGRINVNAYNKAVDVEFS